jgi:hypothetical protein
MAISKATYCNWKKKYGGLGVPEYRRPPHLGPARLPSHLLTARWLGFNCMAGTTSSYSSICGMPVCYDAQRRCILLRREGWMDNHQRVHCLHRSKGLHYVFYGPSAIGRLGTR